MITPESLLQHEVTSAQQNAAERDYFFALHLQREEQMFLRNHHQRRMNQMRVQFNNDHIVINNNNNNNNNNQNTFLNDEEQPNNEQIVPNGLNNLRDIDPETIPFVIELEKWIFYFNSGFWITQGILTITALVLYYSRGGSCNTKLDIWCICFVLQYFFRLPLGCMKRNAENIADRQYYADFEVYATRYSLLVNLVGFWLVFLPSEDVDCDSQLLLFCQILVYSLLVYYSLPLIAFVCLCIALPFVCLYNDYIFPQYLAADRPRRDEEIDKLVIKTCTEDDIIEIKDCSICMEDYVVGEDELIILPCQHIFHEGCVRTWLHIKGSCPLCRHPIDDPHQSSANTSANVEEVDPVEM